MDSRLWSLVPVFVSIFGLMSCESKPNETPSTPRLIEDSWDVTMPEIKNPDHPSLDRPLKAGNAASAFPNSVIHFPSLARDLDSDRRVSVKVDSKCRFEQAEFKESHQFDSESSVLLSDMLPLDLLKAWREQTSTTCDFKLTVSNEIGSTKTFTLSQITVTELEKFSSLPQWSERMASLRVGPNPLGSASEMARLDLSKPNAEEFSVEVVCDHFQNKRNVASAKPLGAEIEELIFGAPNVASALDLRKAITRQTCRLIVSGRERGTGHESRWASPMFPVQFPIQPGIVTKTYEYSSATITNPNQTLYSLTIQNPYPFPIAYRIPASLSNVVTVQPTFVFTDGRLASMPVLSGSLQATVTNPEMTIIRDGYLYVSIPAKAATQVRMNVVTNRICYPRSITLVPPLAVEWYPLLGYLAGYHISVSQVFVLERLANWNANSQSLTSPVLNEDPFRNMPESNVSIVSNEGKGRGLAQVPSPSHELSNQYYYCK